VLRHDVGQRRISRAHSSLLRGVQAGLDALDLPSVALQILLKRLIDDVVARTVMALASASISLMVSLAVRIVIGAVPASRSICSPL